MLNTDVFQRLGFNYGTDLVALCREKKIFKLQNNDHYIVK